MRRELKYSLVDNAVARELPRLAAISADLDQAARALTLAVDQRAAGHAEVASYLEEAAVHHYWICFSASRSRRPLLDEDLPAELHPAQKALRDHRNRVLAHSHGDIRSRGVLIIIARDGEGVECAGIAAGTETSRPFFDVLDQLPPLIAAAAAFVQSRREDLEGKLINSFSPEELRARWAQSSMLPAKG